MTVLLGAGALLVGGCGPKPIAATPREAVANLIRSTAGGDEEVYLQTVYAGRGNEDFVRAMLPYEQEKVDIVRKFAKAYGQAEAAKFSMLARPSLFLVDAAKIQVAQEGDKAVATVPGMPGEVFLIKRRGYWMVDAKPMLFRKAKPKTAEERKMLLEIFEHYTAGAKDAKKTPPSEVGALYNLP